MPRSKKMTSLALDPGLLAEVDEWIKSQPAPPTKTSVHESALRLFLDVNKANPPKEVNKDEQDYGRGLRAANDCCGVGADCGCVFMVDNDSPDDEEPRGVRHDFPV